MARTNNDLRCEHVRGSHVVPGWGCCNGAAYNGYQRSNCKRCGHKSCYELESTEGREAIELRLIGHSPVMIKEWLARKSGQAEPSGQLIDSSGLNIVMLRTEGIRELQSVLTGWDGIVALVTQLEADRQARIEAQSKRSSAKGGRSAGKRRRVA